MWSSDVPVAPRAAGFGAAGPCSNFRNFVVHAKTPVMQANAAIQKPPRHFLPESFRLTTWDAVAPYFKALQDQPINSVQELEGWLKNLSELEAVISEDASWRQIRMTCDTTNEEYRNAFTYFCTEIQPRLQPVAFELNKKLLACPYTKELDQKKYFTYLRSVKKSVELFREKNVPLISSVSVMQQQYGEITGAMTIEVDGREYTLQQASKFLESRDRN